MTSLLASAEAFGLYRGETRTLTLTLTQPDPDFDAEHNDVVPVSLVGATLWFTLKKNIDSEEVLLQKVSTDAEQIEIVDAAGGQARIYLTSEDTSGLSAGTYMFDLWVRLASGETYPVVKPSQLQVLNGVTRL